MTKDSAASEPTALLAVSEETPLLQANSEVFKTHPEIEQSNGTFPFSSIASTVAGGSNGSVDEVNDDKPLPLGQIFLLCGCRMLEPIAFFSIFPYINNMIEDTGGIEEQDVGFYSGLIESLFSLTQMTLMISWGRAADRFGRKPVLVFSLFGLAIATSLFGLSKTMWQMILFRCLAGVFSGTIVTVRTMISEHSTRKTQARAFSYFAFVGNMGIFFGPLIGGALADPAKQYGGIFERSQFLRDYPYALPSFVTGAIGLLAAVISAFFIEETLQTKKSDSGKPTPPPMSTKELLKSQNVPTALFFYGYIALLGLAYTAVVPVFWFTSIQLGGFGFSPLQISSFLGLAGLSQAIWTLLVFPPAQHRWGTSGIMRFCGYVWPINFLISPLCNFFLRRGWAPAFWTVMPLFTVMCSSASMAVTCVQLVLNDVSPSPAVLGTLNAVALAMLSAIRAMAPASFASLFATGVRNQILGGYFVWVILFVIGLGASFTFRSVPERADDKVQNTVADEEEET